MVIILRMKLSSDRSNQKIISRSVQLSMPIRFWTRLHHGYGQTEPISPEMLAPKLSIMQVMLYAPSTQILWTLWSTCSRVKAPSAVALAVMRAMSSMMARKRPAKGQSSSLYSIVWLCSSTRLFHSFIAARYPKSLGASWRLGRGSSRRDRGWDSRFHGTLRRSREYSILLGRKIGPRATSRSARPFPAVEMTKH